ncbi:MAG: DUF2628 domain-containing protein [Rhodospirillaceae bacterium]|jgi:hypothetical protein
MQVYTVHLRREGLDPDRDVVLVKEGFCWPAFLLTGLWALWHRMWLAALTVVTLSVLSGVVAGWLGADSFVQGAVGCGISVLFGFVGGDLRRGRLKRDGFAEAGVSCGDDGDAALLQFLRRHPEIADTP